MARGTPLPIQISTWLGVIMEHVEDMAYKRKGPASIQRVHPMLSRGSIICLVAAVDDQILLPSPSQISSWFSEDSLGSPYCPVLSSPKARPLSAYFPL